MLCPDARATAQARSLRSLIALVFGDCFGACGGHVSKSGRRRLRSRPWHYTDDSVLACGLLTELLSAGSLTVESAALALATAWRADAARGFSPTTADCMRSILQGDPPSAAAQARFDGAGSRGNGAAMRVAPVGAWLPPDHALVREVARTTALPTHTHDEAIDGAVVVAVLANQNAHHGSCTAVLQDLPEMVRSPAMAAKLAEAFELSGGSGLAEAVAALGNGSQCTALDTIPICVWIVSRCLDDLGVAYWMAVEADGDRDTCAAIVGGIIGAAGQFDVHDLPAIVGLPASTGIRECFDLPESASGFLDEFHGRD